MRHRLSIIPLAILLAACLAALPACKKKPPADTGGGSGGDSTPGPSAPANVSTDLFVYAHLDAKSIRDSALFKEIKEAVDKAGGTEEWDKAEGEAVKEIGFKPTDLDSVTACVTEMSDRGDPKYVLIVSSSKSIKGAALLKNGKDTKANADNLYPSKGEALVDFPDDKTVVLLHPDLAKPYLDGYSKNRTGWPMNAELAKAAAGHTAFAVIQIDKLPAKIRNEREAKEFADVLAVRKITLTADLKGKELSISARGSFADAAAAGKAKDMAQKFVGLATTAVDQAMTGKGELGELAMFMPALKEAQRAVKATKVEVSGSDLTIAASYKADFDIGAMIAEGFKKAKEGGPQLTARNNLKQIGLALHTYHDVKGQLPIHGIGANDVPLRNAKDTPLLSWRVAILPYIEQDNLYKQFKLNEPWNSAHNMKLVQQMPKLYAPVSKPGQPGQTHMQMVVGPGAMQPVGTKFDSITDGLTNTIAVVEAATPVVWTKPDDVMLPAKLAPGELKKKFGGQFPGGFNVALWDGSVRFVRDSISERNLGFAINPRDNQVFDWDK
jgi:Protein of unknown function (DUF1559)